MRTPIIAGAADLLARYDVVFSDIWGVIHNGQRPFEQACAALARFRAEGGTVVLISNAPLPWDRVAEILQEIGVRKECWDAIVASGDIALGHVAASGYERILALSYGFDRILFDRLALAETGVADADAIVCTGVRNERAETPDSFRPMLEEALTRQLPFVCANPDLVVDVGGNLLTCAGAVADLYERMGGPVYWAGKPHAPVYEAAQTLAEELRASPLARDRILAIGDSLRTDIAGASAFGIDSIFVATGIHRDALTAGDEMAATGLDALVKQHGVKPAAAMLELRW